MPTPELEQFHWEEQFLNQASCGTNAVPAKIKQYQPFLGAHKNHINTKLFSSLKYSNTSKLG